MLNEIAEGLKIFDVYLSSISAEHDEINVCCDGPLDEEDIEKLESLNWRQTDPNNCPKYWGYTL